MTKFDGVIFDLDGTLLDSLEDIANAANATLAKLNLPTWPIENYKHYVGDGVRILFERALAPPNSQSPDASTSDILESCLEIYQNQYNQNWDRCSKPYPGIPEMLHTLHNAGLKLAVLSNKPEPFTLLCIQRFFPDIPFDLTLGHSDRFPRKPDPTSAKWIAAQFSTNPQRIAYVGDTNTDMQTAVGANLFPIGVSWGFRSEQEILAAGAKIMCHPSNDLQQALL
jgi:phosphoglycolate phosphatase